MQYNLLSSYYGSGTVLGPGEAVAKINKLRSWLEREEEHLRQKKEQRLGDKKMPIRA